MKSKRPNNETRDVVGPVLHALASLGFFVVTQGSDFTKAVKILRMSQWMGVVWRQNTGGMMKEYQGRTSHIRFCPKGVSDIVGIRRDGRWMAIECKRPNQKATAEQVAFMDSIRLMGGVAMLSHGAQDVFDRRDIIVPSEWK